MIPMMELAAANVASQRSSMSAAAGSAGIHSPASYMRQAMDRGSRPSGPPPHATTRDGSYASPHPAGRPGGGDAAGEGPPREPGASPRPSWPSHIGGGTIEPGTHQPSTPPSSTREGPPPAAEPPSTGASRASPPAGQRQPPESPPPPPPGRRPRPPEPPPDRRPPPDRGER
jgi:hypothetical protein